MMMMMMVVISHGGGERSPTSENLENPGPSYN